MSGTDLHKSRTLYLLTDYGSNLVNFRVVDARYAAAAHDDTTDDDGEFDNDGDYDHGDGGDDANSTSSSFVDVGGELHGNDCDFGGDDDSDFPGESDGRIYSSPSSDDAERLSASTSGQITDERAVGERKGTKGEEQEQQEEKEEKEDIGKKDEKEAKECKNFEASERTQGEERRRKEELREEIKREDDGESGSTATEGQKKPKVAARASAFNANQPHQKYQPSRLLSWLDEALCSFFEIPSVVPTDSQTPPPPPPSPITSVYYPLRHDPAPHPAPLFPPFPAAPCPGPLFPLLPPLPLPLYSRNPLSSPEPYILWMSALMSWIGWCGDIRGGA